MGDLGRRHHCKTTVDLLHKQTDRMQQQLDCNSDLQGASGWGVKRCPFSGSLLRRTLLQS
jgi:hypothetical protein